MTLVASKILKVRRAALSDLLHGKAALTPEMALRIEPPAAHATGLRRSANRQLAERSPSSVTLRLESLAAFHLHPFAAFTLPSRPLRPTM